MATAQKRQEAQEAKKKAEDAAGCDFRAGKRAMGAEGATHASLATQVKSSQVKSFEMAGGARGGAVTG